MDLGNFSNSRFYRLPYFWVRFYKTLLLESPHHTQIAWHLLPWPTRFDLVVCSVGIKDPNLLLFRTSLVVVVLEIFWIVIKLCAVWCYVCCCCDVSIVNFVAVFFLFLFCVAALLVRSFAVTNVTFPALFIGFCISLYRVM